MHEKISDRDDRLRQTDCGRALLSLLEHYGGTAELAAFIGVAQPVVTNWVMAGRASTQGAIEIARATGREREEFRPDLVGDQWDRPRGKRLSGAVEPRTEDAKLLVDLANQHGSTIAFCEAAAIKPSDYHTWKSRGRIPAIKLPSLLAMKR